MWFAYVTSTYIHGGINVKFTMEKNNYMSTTKPSFSLTSLSPRHLIFSHIPKATYHLTYERLYIIL